MSLNSVSEDLLVANNLQHVDLLSVLEMMSQRPFTYGDLYFQSHYHESWMIEKNIIKDGSYNFMQGIGIRVIKDEQTGFAYTDQLTLDALTKGAVIACSIANQQMDNNKYCLKFSQIQTKSLYSQLNPLLTFSEEDKIELLMKVNSIARNMDHRVQEVTASLSGTFEQILVASTDGTLATDIRPLVRLFINVQVEADGRREQGSSGGGGRYGYNFFLDPYMHETRVDYWSKEAVRIALINLYAVEAPAGTIPVVLGPGWPGILLHEAVGHGLEGDFNRRGSSVFNGKIGKRVAAQCCTVVDDGTLMNLRGSLSIDDEGVPSQRNILIEHGILKKYMQDKLNAKLMNTSLTGNGRRESYAFLPMPRMTNTYMLAGNSDPKEIIASVDYGIYAPNFSGGQVDITSGKFVFSTSEAYLIKNGVITKPIKGVTLIGSGIEVMQQISMVGNDLTLDSGVGVCIKNGQRIPVGVGQPTLKLDKITVGGTM
ncbi:metalloprotease TldD [Blochmannia endosymbiont of Camponotus (Colobopsis) obliquus]|uniref:metalloprotease TldD n=1 Tax=Blochmannia endosymbiont of Camponotus (Colobopsis) obliquus TaxID=1505597 RepID=UPI00061A61EF|nr:metalloprotease TldD [Blochmannia endosymbiont of Camponotus (Colobopsis) obliquus]AKC60462.1 Protein TldD [Blochmannia endosymbiont of Camponotus (Colobopsis) obliquus]